MADRFEIRAWLSSDGTSVAVRAWDREVRREAFGRILLPTAEAEAQEAVTREARLLLNHRGEAGFPALVDAGRLRETGAAYLMQESVSGSSFGEAVGSLTPARRIEVFLEALSPVGRLHEEGLVHCALTPQHVRVVPDGRVVLLDFRAVHTAGARADGTGRAAFRAPEQSPVGRPVGPYTDVYALGGILYVAITGYYPYGRKGYGSGRRLRPPSHVNRSLPPELDAIVLKALAIDPRERYASAAELQAALAEDFGTATDPDALDCGFTVTILENLKRCATATGTVCTMVLVGLVVAGKQILRGATFLVQGLCHLATATPRRRIVALCATLLVGSWVLASLAWRHSPFRLAHSANQGTHVGMAREGSPTVSPNTYSEQLRSNTGADKRVATNSTAGRGLGETTAAAESISPNPGFALSPEPTFSLEPLEVPFEPTTNSRDIADPPANRTSRIRFLTWPAARVYVDGTFVTEAPSPYRFTFGAGVHTVELRAKRGGRRTIQVRLQPDRFYVMTFDFDSGQLDIEEAKA